MELLKTYCYLSGFRRTMDTPEGASQALVQKSTKGAYLLSMIGFCLLLTKLSAQPCDYDLSLYYLESQEEVEEFADFFSDCSYLTGELFISGSDITDLSPLIGFDSIDALTILFCENLTDLNGLENVVYIRDLWFFGNPLTDFTGLEGLEEVAGQFIPEDVPSLNGLSSLTFIDSFIISGNPAFEDFAGLIALDSIGYWLVDGASSEIDFSGLPASLGIGHLRWSNTAQQNFAGFENLEHLSKLELSSNPNLVSIAELSGITSLEALHIESSLLLEDLDGLENVEHIGTIFLHSLTSIPDFTGLSSLVTVDKFTLSAMEGLSSFMGLSSLEAINTELTINTANIESFTGLPNLSTAPRIIIANMNLLTDFQGFAPLLTEMDNFQILGAFSLTTLQGLDGLERIDTLILSFNQSLQDLSGLSGMSEMKKLRLQDLPNLHDLTGLENLTTLDELDIINNDMLDALVDWSSITRMKSINIEDNNVLDTIDAWPNLDTVDLDLKIRLNSGLSVVDLDALQFIGRDLIIEGNAELDTALFPSLSTISNSVEIVNNPQLENCCLFQHVLIGNELILEDNSGTCQSTFHMTQYCPDEDDDGVDDREDNCPGVPNSYQGDQDNDGVGDACDNCPHIANSNQTDDNNNHIGNACETPEAGKVGINEPSPLSGLHIKDLDVYHDGTARGIIMTSPSGNCFRLLVNDEGNLYTIPISCPE